MTQQSINIDAILAFDQANRERLQRLSMQERGERIIAACHAAAAVEASRLQMGMPPTRPSPWPQSTWAFLAEAAQRVRNG